MIRTQTQLLAKQIAMGLLWLSVVSLVVGCGQSNRVDETYGRRRGRTGGASVNGTAVLGDIFEENDCRVRSWSRLSPRLQKEDVLVLVIDNFALPSQDEYDFLEEWLSAESGRTLVFIGRDYDAAIEYWSKIAPRSTPEEAEEAQRRLAKSIVTYQQRRDAAESKEPEESSPWFQFDFEPKPRFAKSLEGPWAKRLGKQNIRIPLSAELKEVSDDEATGHWAGDLYTEVLLSSTDEVIAMKLARAYWDDSQIIVASNGSFLLNLPLANPQHQILAGQLVDACGSDKRVTFVEGETLKIASEESPIPTGWEAFTQWPLSVILIHLTVVGIIFCFASFPIFGKPRREEADSIADFGKHITALGALLERTGDDDYARAQLRAYHDGVRDNKQATAKT